MHLACSIMAVGAGVALRISPVEWCALIAAMALVWMAEALNTAIETLCDRVCGTFDPAIGMAKDLAAAAVLLAAIAAALIGLLVFLPHALEHAW